MKMPTQPPDLKTIIISEPSLLEKIAPLFGNLPKEYLHWDKLRHLAPPPGFSKEEWWAAMKLERLSQRRATRLATAKGEAFSFHVPDSVNEVLHLIDMGAGGKIAMPEPVTNPQTRDQYLISSLIHEAITSSQLEGAVTTRAVAKEMIRSGRPPANKSEKMILNNYLTMRMIIDLRDRPLSPDLVFEIHHRITEDTLDTDGAGGRFRRTDETITVEDDKGEIFHVPPPADQLEARMKLMCEFANGEHDKRFVHPVVRAILLHFWLAYDHPFVDGNGRTARALFYWAMLRSQYWLFEFISISDILTQSPSAYYRAFCYTETDENDLTYFLVHQVDVIQKAIDSLHRFIDRKCAEISETEKILRTWADLNHRQVALIGHALRHPGEAYTIGAHQRSHEIAYETARTDILKLVEAGLFTGSRRSRGRGVKDVYLAVPNISQKLKARRA